MTPRILAISGSSRTGSFNQQLIRLAANGAEEAGADVTMLDWNEYELPIFNEDLESSGTPEDAIRLKQLFVEHHGLLIASPEYNSSVSPLLKNLIDWVSRPAEAEPPLVAYQNKYAAIMAASPGGLGGLRGLVHLRSILGNIGVTVIPDQLALRDAYKAFNEDGDLTEPKQLGQVHSIGAKLATTLMKIHA